MWRKKRLEALAFMANEAWRQSYCSDVHVEEIRRWMSGKVNKKERKMGRRADVLALGGMVARSNAFVVQATLKLCDQDASGWPQLLSAWRYFAWLELVYVTWIKNGIWQALDSPKWPDGAYVLAAAMAFGRRDFAERFLTLAPATWELNLYDYKNSALPEFLLRLAARWLDLPLQIPVGQQFCKLGKYATIFDCWDEPIRISKMIRWMADERILDWKSNRLMMIVGHDLVRDFPAEILSVYRVRQDSGVETPACEHPVLEPPFDRLPPDNIAPQDDPLLEDVIAWIKQRTPELADCHI